MKAALSKPKTYITDKV